MLTSFLILFFLSDLKSGWKAEKIDLNKKPDVSVDIRLCLC